MSLAELYLVKAAVENELKADCCEPLFIGESKEELDSGFKYLAVPKSASKRCQFSFIRRLPGLRSL